jgi:hypothetical protein
MRGSNAEEEEDKIIPEDDHVLQQIIAEQRKTIKNLLQKEKYREAERALSDYGERQAKLGLTCNFGNLKAPEDQKDMGATLKFIERLVIVNSKRDKDDPFVISILVSVFKRPQCSNQELKDYTSTTSTPAEQNTQHVSNFII